MISRNVILLFFLLGFSFSLVAQRENPKDILDEINDRLQFGDQVALKDIIPFFEDTDTIIEFVGHHYFRRLVKSRVREILTDHTLFLENEIDLYDTSITAIQYIDFLEDNWGLIKFDQSTNTFLITSVAKRNTDFKLKQLTSTKIARLKKQFKTYDQHE